MCDAYCSNLSKWLDQILKPHIPKHYLIKDSFDFVEKMHGLSIPNSYMVSFDVRSLFTNVPLDDTIDHICSIIDFDKFPINKKTLKTLLSLACKNVLFQFDDKLYIQNDGVAMGSKLAPTLANFAMDLIEKQFDRQPLFYQRYVDDVFAVFKNKLEAVEFFNYLNSLNKNIQFTMEHEQEKQLKFLDVVVHKNDDKFETEWTLKDTNTGIYVLKESFAPFKYKTAAICSLIYRAKRFSSKDIYFASAYNKIASIFINNGFHAKVIEKIRDKILNSRPSNGQSDNDVDRQRIYWRLPHIKEKEKQTLKTVHSINRILPDTCKLSVVFDTFKTSKSFPNKDKVPMSLARL